MKLFCYDTDNAGCYWYRLLTPFKKIEEMCINNSFSYTFKKDLVSIDQIGQYDMVVFQRATDALAIEIIEYCKEHNIPTVYEIDDSLMNIDPENPAYRYHERPDIRYCTTKLLGATDFLTVSTKNLAEYYGTYYNPDNICVLPNSVSMTDTLERRHEKYAYKPSTRFRILVTGGSSHKKDWEILKPVIFDLCSYLGDKFEVLVFGYYPEYLKNTKQIFYVKPVPVKEYLSVLASLSYDLMLVPLEDIEFNNYKSNLKFVEAGYTGRPVVASQVPAYTGCIKHEENGWLLPNKTYSWVKLLRALSKQKERINEVGKAAMQTVADDYNIDINWKKWATFYNKILSSFGKNCLIEGV